MTQPGGLPEFDAMRRRLQGQYSQKRSEADDALQRRFAANGMLNSGAYAKQAQVQGNELTQQETDAQGQLGLQEMQELQRRKEITEGRDFQRSEREGSQGFAAGEAEKGRVFTGGMFDKEFGLKRDLANAQFLGADSFARRQQKMAEDEFTLNKQNSGFNNAQIIASMVDEYGPEQVNALLSRFGLDISQFNIERDWMGNTRVS